MAEDEFRDWLIPRMGNKETAKQYAAQVHLFLAEYCAYNPAISDKELLDCATRFINANSRAWNRKYAIRKFLLYANRPGLYDLLPTNPMPPRRQLVKRLLPAKIIEIVTLLGEPYKTIFALQFAMGCRINAALKIRKGDIDYDEVQEMYRISLREKGQRARTSYIDNNTAQILQNYILANGITQGPLFNVKYRTALRHIDKVAKEVVGRRIGTHTMRHSRIMQLKGLGYDNSTIRKFISITLAALEKYTAEAGEDTIMVAKKVAPSW